MDGRTRRAKEKRSSPQDKVGCVPQESFDDFIDYSGNEKPGTSNHFRPTSDQLDLSSLHDYRMCQTGREFRGEGPLAGIVLEMLPPYLLAGLTRTTRGTMQRREVFDTE